MDLDRSGGMLTLTVAATLVLSGCRDRAPSAMPPATPPAPAGSAWPAASRAPLTAAELAAYARGRERELALLRAALDRLRRPGADSATRTEVVAGVTTGEEREGAAAAGLAVERYHALVARTDSALRDRGRAAGAASEPPNPRDAGSVEEWRRLDSLRVELAVLRTRFEAAVAAGVAP